MNPVTVGPIDPRDVWLTALLLRDPNPIHLSSDAVRAAGLGDREIVQGAATMAYLMNVAIAAAGRRDGLRQFRCRFSANVFVGDTVTASGTVTATDERGVELALTLQRSGRERPAVTATARITPQPTPKADPEPQP